MPKGGFWDFQDYWPTVTSGRFWFDSEWKQRRDINDLEVVEQEVQYEVGSLGTAVAQIQKQVLELSMTVVVMSQMLHEAGALDVPKLQARIDAELDKLRPKPRPATAATVNDVHPVKPKPVDTQVACQRCGNSVPSSRTTITERYGTVCDSCAERG